MFKRFSIIVTLIIMAGVSLTLASVYILNQNNLNNYIDSSIEHRTYQVEYYLDNVVEDMGYAIDSHAYWSEAILYLNNQDDEWLEENATSYIIEDGLFSTDYILVASEDMIYTQESGGNYADELLNHPSVLDSLYNNTINTFSTQINDQPAVIISSPFLDNNNENPVGLYVCVAFFDNSRLDALAELVGDGLVSLQLSNQNDVHKPTTTNTNTIEVLVPLYDSDLNIHMVFEDDELYDVFYKQRNHIFYIVLISASGVGLAILLFIYIVVKRLKQLTRAIAQISDGDYTTEVKEESSKYLFELNELSSSVNRMSTDIKNHLKTIDQNYLEMVNVILHAVEINDAYTSKHNIEVGNYAKIIAEEINYEDIDHIILASKLHDIGKISIPGHILNKPGRLTDEEYTIIKTHPTEGYKIIEQITYFEQIKLGVKYHHEHWDGSGYPEGLKGTQIPLIAQIISIADVYDAVTSDRSYRKGLSHEQAVEIIVSDSGKLFNPVLVDAFIKRVDDFHKIYEYNTHRR